MSVLRITTTGEDGTIRFLEGTGLDFARLFHKKNIEKVLSDQTNPIPGGEKIVGTTIMPAFLDITPVDSDFEDFERHEEGWLMVAVLDFDEDTGIPTSINIASNALCAVSCRPFQKPGGEFKVRIVTQPTPAI